MRRAVTSVLAAAALAACGMEPVVPVPTVEEAARPQPGEQMVPDALRLTGTAVWDGRPTLGGLWIARPDVESRRVLIETREGSAAAMLLPNMSRDHRFQLSSDLAGILGVGAGKTVAVRVTALMRPDARDSAGPATPVAQATSERAAAPSPQRRTQASRAIQVGVFAVEANAQAAVSRLAKAGIAAEIRRSGAVWRVTIPSERAGGDGALGEVLAKVKQLGFADAYAVAL